MTASVVGVLLPVLQEVVAADVDPVARGDERRQAEAPAYGVVEQRHPERAGLGEEAEPAARAGRAATARRSATRSGSVLMTPNELGPEDPHAAAPGQRDEPPLPLGALVAGLGEARWTSRRGRARPWPRSRRRPARPPRRARRRRRGRPAPGTSRTLRYDGTPATSSAWWFTTWTVPVKPPSRRCRSTTWPERASAAGRRRRPRPSRGCSSRWTDRASARCSRA